VVVIRRVTVVYHDDCKSVGMLFVLVLILSATTDFHIAAHSAMLIKCGPYLVTI